MDDLFKKFLYTSVGLVSFTADKLRESIEKLVQEDKISEEEGKKIVDEFIKNTQTKKDEFESQLKMLTEKTLATFKFSSSNNDFADLQARVEALEAKQKAAAKRTTKKAEATA